MQEDLNHHNQDKLVVAKVVFKPWPEAGAVIWPTAAAPMAR